MSRNPLRSFGLVLALYLGACGPLVPPGCKDDQCGPARASPVPAPAECNGWVVRVWTADSALPPYQEYFVSRYTPDDLLPVLRLHALRDSVPRIEVLNYHWSCVTPDQLPPDVPGGCTYPTR